MPTYKIIATCIECATVLQANTTRVMRWYPQPGGDLLTKKAVQKAMILTRRAVVQRMTSIRTEGGIVEDSFETRGW